MFLGLVVQNMNVFLTLNDSEIVTFKMVCPFENQRINPKKELFSNNEKTRLLRALSYYFETDVDGLFFA